jgi:hypothetical protein
VENEASGWWGRERITENTEEKRERGGFGRMTSEVWGRD